MFSQQTTWWPQVPSLCPPIDSPFGTCSSTTQKNEPMNAKRTARITPLANADVALGMLRVAAS